MLDDICQDLDSIKISYTPNVQPKFKVTTEQPTKPAVLTTSTSLPLKQQELHNKSRHSSDDQTQSESKRDRKSSRSRKHSRRSSSKH